jgi:DNA-binding response OmpR family regulator
VARAAGARRLVFTHHDPLRTDDDLDRIVEHHRAALAAEGASLQLFAAAEDQVVDVDGSDGIRIRPTVQQPATHFPPALKTRPVLVAIPDREAGKAVREALHADGVAVINASDASSAVRLSAQYRPSLILLDEHISDTSGLEVCHQIREIGTRDALEATIVIVGTREDPSSAAVAGVSDWLIEPFTTTYVRTRIRAWLLRARCRWARAPLPENEEGRLAVLHRLKLLDTQPEERFDRLTRLAAALFEVPIALVSLVDRDRQWLKSCHGCSLRETSRESSFCAHAILEHAVTVVPDTLLDSRFADNPHVTDEPHIRFYAGCPLASDCGRCVGTLCIIDVRPRELNEIQIGLLRDLGHLVERELSSGAG